MLMVIYTSRFNGMIRDRCISNTGTVDPDQRPCTGLHQKTIGIGWKVNGVDQPSDPYRVCGLEPGEPEDGRGLPTRRTAISGALRKPWQYPRAGFRSPRFFWDRYIIFSTESRFGWNRPDEHPLQCEGGECYLCVLLITKRMEFLQALKDQFPQQGSSYGNEWLESTGTTIDSFFTRGWKEDRIGCGR